MNFVSDLLKAANPGVQFNNFDKILDYQEITSKFPELEKFLPLDPSSPSINKDIQQQFQSEENKNEDYTSTQTKFKLLNAILKGDKKIMSFVKMNDEEVENYDKIGFFKDLNEYLRLPDLEKLVIIDKNTIEMQFSQNYKLILVSVEENLRKKSKFNMPKNIMKNFFFPYFSCFELYQLLGGYLFFLIYFCLVCKEWKQMIKQLWPQAVKNENQCLTLYGNNAPLLKEIGTFFHDCSTIVNASIECINWQTYNEQLQTDQLSISQKKMVCILLCYLKINPLNILSISNFNEACWNSIIVHAKDLFVLLKSTINDNYQFFSIQELKKIKENFLWDESLSINQYEQNQDKNFLFLAFLIQSLNSYAVLKNCLSCLKKQNEWCQQTLKTDLEKNLDKHKQFLEESTSLIELRHIAPEFPFDFFSQLQPILTNTILHFDFSSVSKPPSEPATDWTKVIADSAQGKEQGEESKAQEEEQKLPTMLGQKQKIQEETKLQTENKPQTTKEQKQQELESLEARLDAFKGVTTLLLAIDKKKCGTIDYQKEPDYTHTKEGKVTYIYMDLQSKFDIFMDAINEQRVEMIKTIEEMGKKK